MDRVVDGLDHGGLDAVAACPASLVHRDASAGGHPDHADVGHYVAGRDGGDVRAMDTGVARGAVDALQQLGFDSTRVLAGADELAAASYGRQKLRRARTSPSTALALGRSPRR